MMSFKRFKDWPENLNIGQYLQVGDVVDKEMYEHFLNILPPHYYFGGMLQVGGVCDHVEDNGFLKPTYLTFVGDRNSDNWIFKGECFSREAINKNPELEPTVTVDKLINSAKSRVEDAPIVAVEKEMEKEL